MNPEAGHRALAEGILAGVGGAANVASVDHCVTRLRLVLHDPGVADRAAVAALAGVLNVVDRGGQFQVVIGEEVPAIHAAMTALPAMRGNDGDAVHGTTVPSARTGNSRPSPSGARAPRRRAVDRVFDVLTGTFQPLLPVLVGSSIVKTVLLVTVELGWLSSNSPAYAVWAAAANAAFSFLPVLVGITASIKLGANPYVGGIIGAALLEANFTGIGPPGTQTTFLGVPLVVIDYGQSVIPPIIAAAMLAVLERWLRRRLPKSLHLVLVPAICLAVLVPATAILFGPFGTYAGEAISDAVGWLWDLSPAIAGAIMGGLWQVFVIFGLHWAFVPIIVNDLSVQGYSLLTGPLVAAVLAQGAATLAVFVRTRNARLRQLSGAAAISAFVAGVTEPSIYGVTLPLRRPFIYACVGGAAGGAIAAAGGSAADSFILPGLITLPAYLSVGSFTMQLVGTATAVALTFTLTMVLGFRDLPAAGAATTDDSATGPSDDGDSPTSQPSDGGTRTTTEDVRSAGPSDTSRPRGLVQVLSPMAGQVLPLAQVDDPVFAGGLLGLGVAIRPVDGEVRSPVSGTVTSVARARHAVGVSSDDGVDVLIHVGIDTVHLAGTHFEALVVPGQKVKAGDALLRADVAALAAAGHDTVTPVVVTNAASFAAVEPTSRDHLAPGDPIITVRLR